MSNIEHLFENGLLAVERARQNNESAVEAFYSEMDYEYNREMLSKVLVPVSELWEIVQYIVFNYCMFCGRRSDL